MVGVYQHLYLVSRLLFNRESKSIPNSLWTKPIGGPDRRLLDHSSGVRSMNHISLLGKDADMMDTATLSTAPEDKITRLG